MLTDSMSLEMSVAKNFSRSVLLRLLPVAYSFWIPVFSFLLPFVVISFVVMSGAIRVKSRVKDLFVLPHLRFVSMLRRPSGCSDLSKLPQASPVSLMFTPQMQFI